MTTQAMVSSQPLPRSTTGSLETQQLSSLQPLLRQLQACSAAEHSSSLPSPPASSYTQSPQPSERHHSPGPDDLSQSILFHISTPDALLSQFQLPSSPSLEGESQPATCCKCHSSGARCTSCKCCREERPCVNCYPGRRGKCTNITSSIPSVSSPHSEDSLQSYSSPPVATPESMFPCASRPCTSHLGSQEGCTPNQISHTAKKKCVVPDCGVLIAPSMWHSHMSLHACGLFPGAVPITWLKDQDLFICSLCHQLVSNTRSRSHPKRCRGRVNIPVTHPEAPHKVHLPEFPIRVYHPLKRFASYIVPRCALFLPGLGQPLHVFFQLP